MRETLTLDRSSHWLKVFFTPGPSGVPTPEELSAWTREWLDQFAPPALRKHVIAHLDAYPLTGPVELPYQRLAQAVDNGQLTSEQFLALLQPDKFEAEIGLVGR